MEYKKNSQGEKGMRSASYMVSIIFMVMMMAFIFFSCNKDDAGGKMEREFMSVQMTVGPVWLNGTSQKLKSGDTLKLGDTIITGENGQVEILVPAKSGIRIYSNSEFVLEKGVINDRGELDDSGFFLGEGRVMVLLRNISKTKMEVRTPTATASVRGTTFVMGYEKGIDSAPGKSELKVVEGRVAVSSGKEPDVEKEVSEGTMVTVEEDKPVEEVKVIPAVELETISREKEELEKRVEETVRKKEEKKAGEGEVDGKKEDEKARVDSGKPVKKPEAEEKPERKAVTQKAPDLKTEKEIKDYYNKLEEIHLDDGSVLVGAVVSQDDAHVRIHTTSGVVRIPTSGIETIKMRQ
jgi:hypothetical protein